MSIATLPRVASLLVAAGTCGSLALGVAVADRTLSVPGDIEASPSHEAMSPEPVRVAIAVGAHQVAPPRAHTGELGFVFRAGDQTYVSMPPVRKLPRHDRPTLAIDDGAVAAIAKVDSNDLPAKLRDWAHAKVTVDGHCKARVIGFAVVSRLIGSTDYAGVEANEWTAATVAEHGASVLAAHIDGCDKGTYARRTALSPVVQFETLDDPTLAAAARTALLASDASRDAQRDFDQMRSSPGKDSWIDHVKVTTRILRHPQTHVVWVAIHAVSDDRSCGDPELDTWGLYRVAADGGLDAVAQRRLSDLWSIDHVIDVDGDGTPELIGRDWLGIVPILARADGEATARLEMPFFGCPC